MNTDDWGRVRALFEGAMDQPPGEVERWLERQAGDDPALRQEVASLLAHHGRAGRFLHDPLSARLPRLLGEPEALAAGETIGAYAIVREIGRGGMGRVYLALDARLGRRVALKALPSHLADDPAQRERLRREARAMAALAHPGICTVYALEETDRGLFIATEYIEGQTLREEMAGADRRPSHAVVSAAHELAAALACAHGRGIIHRDVKPENVIRGTDGRLKILDFGLAVDGAPAGVDHADRPPHRLTEPGILVGTPGYMAPEQLRGDPADARSDIFALGVLLYEYACDVHPFQARDPLGVAARVLEHDPAPIPHLRPEIPAAVAAAIERCLRKRPAERWPSAVELALAMAAPAPALPQPIGEPRTVWWRTHQLGMIALYAVAAGLAWHIKEWTQGAAAAAFVAIGLAGGTNGVLRGHLLFTWWTNREAIGEERSRIDSMTLGVDLALAAALAAAGILAEPARPLAATVTIALAAAIALARTIVEPATTRAAFDRGA